MIENFDKDILFKYIMENNEEAGSIMKLYKTYNIVNKYSQKTEKSIDEVSFNIEKDLYEKVFPGKEPEKITEKNKILFNFKLLMYESNISRKELSTEVTDWYNKIKISKNLKQEDIDRIKQVLVLEEAKLDLPITFFKTAYDLFEEKYNFIVASDELNNQKKFR